MFIFGNLLLALANVLSVLLYILEIVILVRVILSWASADPYNQFVRMVFVISEPFLSPFRKLLPPWKLGGLDFSPVLALIVIYFIKSFLISTLMDLAYRLH